MNDILSQLFPANVWLHLHIVASAVAVLALLYLVEQLVVYGGGPFSNFVIATYRIILCVTIIGLFADAVDLMSAAQSVRPITTLVIAGVSGLSVLIAVTHKRAHHFGD